MNLIGENGSYFHNNYLQTRDEDSGNNVKIIDGSGTDVICRLNGYAIIPIEKYMTLIKEPFSQDHADKIVQMRENIAAIM